MYARYPYYISALLDGFAGNTMGGRDPYHKAMQIKYTFNLPTRVKVENSLKQLVTTATRLATTVTVKIEDTLKLWSTVANISFVENNRSPEIYFASTLRDEDFHGTTVRSDLDFSSFQRLGRASYRPLYVLFNEHRFREWENDELPARIQEVLTHEVAHPFEFEHPFELTGNFRDTIFPLSQQNTWHSVLDYYPLLTPEFQQPIRRITPAIFDIEAVQFAFGAKLARLGDDVYDLTASKFTTPVVSTIYDCGGIDTFSAAGYRGKALINLRNGIDYYSRVGDSFYTQAFKTTIENAHGGSGENTIFLNSHRNNVVLDNATTSRSTIVTFKYDHGIDTVEGFSSSRGDVVRVEKPLDDEYCSTVKIIPMTEKFGITVVVTEDSKINLPGVDPQTVTEQNIQFAQADDPRQCLPLEPIYSRFFAETYRAQLMETQQLNAEACPVAFPPETTSTPLPTHRQPSGNAKDSQTFSDCKTDISQATSRASGSWGPTFFKQATELVKSTANQATALVESTATIVNDFLLQPGVEFLAANQREILSIAATVLVEQAMATLTGSFNSSALLPQTSNTPALRN